jgi:mono/diheme cytochrome c family protein
MEILKRIWPRTYVLPVCAAAVLTACSPPAGTAGKGAESATTGEALFEQHCGACHGPEGRGPSLVALRALSEEELRDAMRNHPPAGDIPARLPASEISDLIEYLAD